MTEPLVLAITPPPWERVLGMWCPRCFLPSAYRVVVASETPGTYTLTGCLGCDEENA